MNTTTFSSTPSAAEFVPGPGAASALAGPVGTSVSRASFRLPGYVLALLTGASLLAARSAQAQATYTDATNGTANFSTAFSPAIPVGGTTTADTLVFSNTATSSQTDDLTQALNANILTFGNTAALTLLQGAGTTIGLGGTNATVNLNNTGTVTDNLILALSSNATFQGAGNATITGGAKSGVAGGGITGSGDALIMNGTGILTLDVQGTGSGTAVGNFTYTGGTFINSGTILYGSSTANFVSNKLGTGTVYLGNTTGSANATLQQLYDSDTLTNNIVVRSGNTGTMTINASGNTSIGNLGGTTTITLGTTGSTGKGLTLGTGVSVVSMGINAVIQDPTGLTAGTAGTVTVANSNVVFSATNIYTGTTLINSGAKLTLGGNTGNGQATAGGALSPSSTITDNGTLAFNRTNAVIQGTDFASAIGGTGGVLQGGTSASVLTLNGANTYGGGTKINQGTITVGTGGTLGATTGALSVNNTNTGAGTAVVLNLATVADTTTGSLSGTLAAQSSGTNTATINTGGAGINFTVNQTATGTYAGTIAGAGNFALGSLSTAATPLTLTGANTYTGTTTVNAGVLAVSTLANGGSNSGIGASSNAATNLVLNGGTLQYTGATTSTDRAFTVGTAGATLDASGTGALTLSGSPVLATNAGTSTLTFTGTSTAANTFSGTLSSTNATGGLTLGKAGTGTWTLGGNGTSTLAKGNITLTGGTLNFGVAGADSPTLTITAATTGVGTTFFVPNAAGVFNMANGSLTVPSGSQYGIVFNGGTGQTFNQTGGSISTSGLVAFSDGGSTDTVTVSGGTLTSTRADGNGQNGITLATRGFTTATVSGTGVITDPTLNMTTSQTSSGAGSIFNLGNGASGGTLVVNRVIAGNGSGGTTFNFNGGTLKASQSDNPGGTTNPSTFLTGITTASVKAGGAIINTNTFNDTIAQPLLTGTATGTPDGGLTKNGAGILTLAAANTYTGPTTVNVGALTLTTTNTALSDTAALSLATSTTLALNGPANTSEMIGSLVLNGVTEPAGVYSASDLTTDFGTASGVSFSSTNGETLTVGAVPEPSTWAAGLTCLGMLGLRLRRRLFARP